MAGRRSDAAPARKRILVVGAGAAGMACADGLSKRTDKFEVTLIDAQGYCGGQMFSIPIEGKKYGAPWMNQGVQGGSYIYHHTFHHFHKMGFEAAPVDLQVSFGKYDKFWTNVFPTQLVEKHQAEIKRFHRAIKIMRAFEVFFAVIPIKISLKMFFLSDEFINYMIYPSLALFLGTGNATPDLSSVMMERLYTSPTYGMWYPIDPKSLSSNLPPMVVFPEASEFYKTWQAELESRGVNVRLNTELTQVLQRSPTVKVALKPRREQADKHNPAAATEDLPDMYAPQPVDQDLAETVEEYDEIVLCCLADTSKRLLGKTARWIEKFVLGATKWSDDVTVTHNDLDYIRKYYTIEFDEQQKVDTVGGRDESERIKRGRTDFKPMYLIKQVPGDPRKLEMCFDCNAFQVQLDQDAPLENHVFQTIFLNKKHQHTWTIDEIKKDKIVRVDWWHQLCHAWTHYVFVVPLMWALNRNGAHTTFAAAWTLVNAHELAIISGHAAAYKLGGEYPKELEKDDFATLCFRLYLLIAHGRWFTRSRA
ncbi:hypothetical protein Q5752_005143 [Cryptotrichosporon argae]